MNWLIYIGGYWITLGFSIRLMNETLNASVTINGKSRGCDIWATAWLLCWIWICWRFIK